jgi:hypothetical protein
VHGHRQFYNAQIGSDVPSIGGTSGNQELADFFGNPIEFFDGALAQILGGVDVFQAELAHMAIYFGG